MTEPTDAPNAAPHAAISSSRAPAFVVDLARSCVEFVRRAVGVELDFTQDTLSVLDHYARAARSEAAERPEALHLVASAIAAYFGEVIRRQHAAFWHLPGDEMASAELRFEDVFLSFSPFAFACSAMGWNPTGDGAEDLGPDAGLSIEEEERDEVAEHLARSPPVTEDEYTLLTTRMEVIQIVADQLRARALSRGLGDVRFDEADYEDSSSHP
jgi:hypothetical protein